MKNTFVFVCDGCSAITQMVEWDDDTDEGWCYDCSVKRDTDGSRDTSEPDTTRENYERFGLDN